MHQTLNDLLQDLHYALRQLGRAPAFTAVAVLTLALGIGVTTAIWSVVVAVVLRPFPFAAPDRVMDLAEHWGQEQQGHVAVGNFVDIQATASSYAALGVTAATNFNLADEGAPERILGARVSPGFFQVFGIPPRLGRTFTPDETQPGQELEVVLGHGLFARRFGGAASILGRTIRLDGRPYRVVGVMPPGFDPTLSGEDLWVPVAWTAEDRARRSDHFLTAVALLKAGVSRQRAQLELDGIMRGLTARFPRENAGLGARLRPLSEVLVGDYRGRLFLLLGAVAFVLLIACGNVANLLLARGAARGKELAIRAALGAGRRRIVRQLLTESALLALLAGIVGLGIAAGGVRVLVGNAPAGIPRLTATRIDGAVLGFALLTALAASLIAGLPPALRVALRDPQSVLKEGGRGMGTARDSVRSGLVMAEVALAVTLLAGAGLLVRSSLNLQRMQLGFQPQEVLTARITLPTATYPRPASVVNALKQVVARLEAMPAVRACAVTSQAPLGGKSVSNSILREGQAPLAENFLEAKLHLITPGYFAVMGIPLQRGRAFDGRDTASGARVMIVSARLAQREWPGADPIGKRIGCCEGSPDNLALWTVAGVAGDVRSAGPTAELKPELYLPVDQAPPAAWTWIQRSMTIVVRGASAPQALAGAVGSAVHEVDPSLPLYAVHTMSEALAGTLAEARFRTLLLGLLGAIGLALAALGIYSVIAYLVSLRTHEMGVRMALGATVGDVVTLLTWQGVRPVLGGVAIGSGIALAATRWMASQLYGVSPADPATFAGVAAILVGVGVGASLIPAWRATRIDPSEALHSA